MTIVDAALVYTGQLGWPVFPAHPTTKRPLIRTGRDHAEHASRDPDVIRGWFEQWPWASLAMPTGAASGVVVIDADAKHDGEALLAQLVAKLGRLPDSMIVRTQSGGIHVYTAHPGAGVRLKSGAGKDSPLGRVLDGRAGVDVRADGGIVLLPPSPGYRWEVTGSAFEPLPERWAAELRTARRAERVAVDVGAITYAGEVDCAASYEALRGLRAKYRRSKREGDSERAELIDRVLEGRALAQPGGRDVAVSRLGYIIGRLLPDIGPETAVLLAARALLAMPVDDGEGYAHWCAKLAMSYEAGARARLEEHERNRLLWERIARRPVGVL